MRVPRLFVEVPILVGAELVLPEGVSRHATQVLRLTAGDPILLFNGDGRDYRACLVGRGKVVSHARVDEMGDPEPHPPIDIHLAIGISKGERMDYALQKAVELGVARLTPLFTERSQVRLDGKRLARRQAHWRGILIAACEQCGRSRLPALEVATGLGDWLSDGREPGWLLDPQAPGALASMDRPAGDRVTLLVGPEGGLGPGEVDRAKRLGFEGVRLGPRILRTETAPLAAIAVVQALWGDLGH